MLNPMEMKILRTVSENQLVTKPELIRMINGSSGGSVTSVESAAKGLVQKNLLAAINPIGSTCYVITQRGVKLLHDGL